MIGKHIFVITFLSEPELIFFRTQLSKLKICNIKVAI